MSHEDTPLSRLHAWLDTLPSGPDAMVSAVIHVPTGAAHLLTQSLADRLGGSSMRIDIASIISKYLGETEKQLAALFEHAQANGVLLVFDEADALFGKRTAVKDTHDRYANTEVNYLLQLIEEYRGLVVLTSNSRKIIAAAERRGLRCWHLANESASKLREG